MPKERKTGDAGEEHARHRDDDRDAGDEHGAAGGGRGGFERRLRALAGVALLHFSSHVEHAVVDADGEADEQHHGRDRLVERDELGDRAEQADRPHDRGQREQQRKAGGDERAEGDDEDHERDRQREELGPLEVLLEGGRQRLAGAGVAELLDAQVGVGLLGGRGGGERGADAVLGGVVLALELEGDERGAVVARELALVALRVGGLDLGDVRGRLEALDDVVDGGGEALVVVRDLAALGLDQYLLARLLREAGGGDRLVGALRLAVAHVLVRQHALADGAADHGGQHDEEDPSENGALPVLRAPAPGAGGEVVLLHAIHPGSGPETLPGGEPPSIGSVVLTPRRAALPPRVGGHPACVS